ncbi:MAG: CotH kinase family protein [Lachnospiraceae bacterium]|nr:CotH kinase family protein [Lachnospiraceae bacterium]
MLLAVLLLTGCTGGSGTDAPAPTGGAQAEATQPAETATPTPSPDVDIEGIDYSDAETFGEAPSFSEQGTFFEAEFSVTVTNAAPNGVTFYTMNGSEPAPDGKGSTRYEEPIAIEAGKGDYPKARTLKAKTFYADGTISPTAVHTYFVAEGITTRFSDSSARLLIISLIGDTADFLGKPDGILYGENYKLRGDVSERPVHVEILDASGSLLVSQYAGARVYGAYSRQNAVKSLKLIARKSYASGVGKFKYDFFGTKNSLGEDIASYDRLVLRSYGNDWQFAFLRDELNQRLLGKAGYPCYEEVCPAIVYLNGSFYNFVWMHESYCDTYFKQKFPDDTKKGEFIVIGGTETAKNPDTDQNDVAECKEFNDAYNSFRDLDYTVESNYADLQKFMDVQNYLDYYAANIYVCNYDWPHNNYKVYRYYADESGGYGDGVYDGRWRFLPHDMDYCYNIYDNPTECLVSTDYLKTVMTKGQRYAPLFTALMAREDCREYFIKRVLELAEGAFSYASVCAEIDAMAAEQGSELSPYIAAMKKAYNTGGWFGNTIWTSVEYVENSRETIRNFAAQREDYLIEQMAKAFGCTVDEIRKMRP